MRRWLVPSRQFGLCEQLGALAPVLEDFGFCRLPCTVPRLCVRAQLRRERNGLGSLVRSIRMIR